MKVWITKNVLTKGIALVEAEINTNAPSMVSYGRMNYAHGDGKDWHRTFESAVARAESLRIAKIESHRKSIAKLEAMKF